MVEKSDGTGFKMKEAHCRLLRETSKGHKQSSIVTQNINCLKIIDIASMESS